MNEKLDAFDLSGDNVGEVEEPAGKKPAPRKKRVTRNAKRTGKSPLLANLNLYDRDDAERDDWDVDEGLTGVLPNIDPLKAEYPEFAFRWIRTMKEGKTDHSYMVEVTNLGWQPLTPDDIPEGIALPVFEMEEVGTLVGISGLMLCIMPQKRYQAIKKRELEDAQNNRATIGSEIRTVGSGGAAPLRTLKSSVRRGPKVQG